MTNFREIYIGRDASCAIRLSPECIYCSSVHGVLYMDGGTLMYCDKSRNGTYVNNNKVLQCAVPIRHGDTIMLAGQYPLKWDTIDQYFPPQQIPQAAPARTVIQQPTYQPEEKSEPNLSKFNWGAFFLYPIWGFFNGCWWAILVGIFCFWAGILLNILFGVFGTRLAWQNTKWSSVKKFERTQHTWAQWGVGLFLASIVIGIIIALTLGSLISSMMY